MRGARKLAAASGLIAHNGGRLGKTLWTEADGGEKVIVRGVWDGEAESRLIADEIETALSYFRTTFIPVLPRLYARWEEAQESQRKGSRIEWPDQVRTMAMRLRRHL